MMISFWAVIDRALNGPICTERDFDLAIFVPNLRKVLEKYKIKFDPANPIPADDDLADRVWQAAMEFLEATGMYCMDTERRIIFSREEIEGALATGPSGCIFGDGKDARVMPRRYPEDKRPPWCSGSGAGPVSKEEYLINIVKTYAEDTLSDGITAPCITNVDGRTIEANSPLGIEGAIRTVLLTREALRRAGRPGMPVVNEVASAIRAVEHIAGHRFGNPKVDYLEIGTVHELKVDLDALNKVAYCQSVNNLTFAENGIIMGGMAGGPAGAAVTAAAYNPVDMLVLRGAAQHPFIVPFEKGTSSRRDALWARSISVQAVARNSPLPAVSPGYTSAGPLTEMAYYEYAAWIISQVVSGGSVEVGAAYRGVLTDCCSPLENIFGNGVAHAMAGMSRTEANKIVLALLEKYEGKIADPPKGKPYPGYFDQKTCAPNGECVSLYREMRKEFEKKFGLEFKKTSPYY
jgi:methylamine--corrinoid protein Co-methyltransferase